jgi:hypothetical protein
MSLLLLILLLFSLFSCKQQYWHSRGGSGGRGGSGDKDGGLARVVVAAVHIMMVVKMAKVALKSEVLAKIAVAA